MIAPETRGDPESPLRWTTKSVRELAEALAEQGHTISHTLVDQVLHALDYSLQANAKTREGRQHEDRDAQFRYINAAVKRFQRQHQPVISVDTKKKELVGDFKNAGREWHPVGAPERVRVHDFIVPESTLAAIRAASRSPSVNSPRCCSNRIPSTGSGITRYALTAPSESLISLRALISRRMGQCSDSSA